MIFKTTNRSYKSGMKSKTENRKNENHVKCLSVHPKSVKIKHLTTNIHKVNRVHSKIDDAFSILTMTDNVSKVVMPHVTIAKYDMALHHFQDNFLIASKVIVLFKLFVIFTRIDRATKDNVAFYTMILFILIFIYQNYGV